MVKPQCECTLEVLNRQREVRFAIDRPVLQAIVSLALQSEREQAAEVSLSFLSDKAMRALHKRFFADPSSTDCMSFPLDSSDTDPKIRHLGEILVCPAVAFLRSNKSDALFWHELTLYFVHGLLHLLGYDDTTREEKQIMRRKERKILSLAAKKQLLLTGSVQYFPPK